MGKKSISPLPLAFLGFCSFQPWRAPWALNPALGNGWFSESWMSYLGILGHCWQECSHSLFLLFPFCLVRWEEKADTGSRARYLEMEVPCLVLGGNLWFSLSPRQDRQNHEPRWLGSYEVSPRSEPCFSALCKALICLYQHSSWDGRREGAWGCLCTVTTGAEAGEGSPPPGRLYLSINTFCSMPRSRGRAKKPALLELFSFYALGGVTPGTSASSPQAGSSSQHHLLSCFHSKLDYVL